jgi:hypothetical protein
MRQFQKKLQLKLKLIVEENNDWTKEDNNDTCVPF